MFPLRNKGNEGMIQSFEHFLMAKRFFEHFKNTELHIIPVDLEKLHREAIKSKILTDAHAKSHLLDDIKVYRSHQSKIVIISNKVANSIQHSLLRSLIKTISVSKEIGE